MELDYLKIEDESKILNETSEQEALVLTRTHAQEMISTHLNADVHLDDETWTNITEIVSDGIREVLIEHAIDFNLEGNSINGN